MSATQEERMKRAETLRHVLREWLVSRSPLYEYRGDPVTAVYVHFERDGEGVCELSVWRREKDRSGWTNENFDVPFDSIDSAVQDLLKVAHALAQQKDKLEDP